MMRTALPADATIPRLLRRNAEERGGAPAMREKSMGIWRSQSWAQYYAGVRDFALGLASIGFKRGDVLAVIGDNRPRLYAAQLAAQCLGGTPAPLYQDAAADELVYVLEHAEASVVVAEDQEQVDKILSIRTRLPRLRLVVYEDARGMFHYRDEVLRSFESVAALGREFGAAHPGYVEAEIAKGQPADVALLCYTSGTTGKPKGAMLSHANLIASGTAFLAQTDLQFEDDWLAYLPMAWIGDAVYTMVVQMIVGFACNCPESPETVQRDLRELGPERVPRRTPHLGEPAHADPGAGVGRVLAEAKDLRVLPRPGDRGRAAARGGQTRARAACARSSPSANSSSTGRCATRSACAARAGA